MAKKIKISFYFFFLLHCGVVLAEQEITPTAYFYFDEKLETVFFKARVAKLLKSTTFLISELWSYSLKDKKWLLDTDHRFVKKEIEPIKIDPNIKSSTANEAINQSFENMFGLFWVKWKEDDTEFSSYIFAGMRCQDVMIGPLEKGDQVALCVPAKNSATAAYVPKPEKFCVKEKSQ